VRVDVTSEGKGVVIRVIDDGPGFPQNVRDHAFDRFTSVRPAESSGDRQRHYGLGLALVSEVAARHGGTVDIEPGTSDGGAVVVVRLPAHP
jgi:signal transduction histidine kinase